MCRILVVEDEFVIAMMLRKKLLNFGFDVGDSVATGEEAIERAEKEKPSIVLMDISLAGGMTGIEAAREILNKKLSLIIFITGFSDIETESMARQLNPSGFLVKPIHFGQLKQMIDSILGGAVNSRQEG